MGHPAKHGRSRCPIRQSHCQRVPILKVLSSAGSTQSTEASSHSSATESLSGDRPPPTSPSPPRELHQRHALSQPVSWPPRPLHAAPSPFSPPTGPRHHGEASPVSPRLPRHLKPVSLHSSVLLEHFPHPFGLRLARFCPALPAAPWVSGPLLLNWAGRIGPRVNSMPCYFPMDFSLNQVQSSSNILKFIAN
jgi:hypothetical protein